jgi:hypothetical protein
MSITKKELIAIGGFMKEKVGTPDQFTIQQVHDMATFLRTRNQRFDRAKWIGFVTGANGPNGGKIRRRR